MDPYERINDALAGGNAGDEDEADGLAGDPRGRASQRGFEFGKSVSRKGRGAEFRAERFDAPESVAFLTRKLRALAEGIGYYVSTYLRRSTGTPVRGPSHCAPPVRAIDFERGIKPTIAAPYTVLTAGQTLDVLDERFNPGHYGVLVGISWIVAWDNPATPGDPYLNCPMTLFVNDEQHTEYAGVTRQLATSLISLNPVSIPVPPVSNPTQGSRLRMRFTNTSAAEPIRITARVKGWQFPVSGTADGIAGGLVTG